MRFLQSIAKDIQSGENIDMYLALLFGLVGALIGIFGAQLEIIVATTSGVLTLLAFGNIHERKQTERLTKLLTTLEKNNDRQEMLALKRDYNTEFAYLIRSATQELCILTRTGDVLDTYLHEMEEAIKRGCTVKIILCAPTDETIRQILLREYSTDSEEVIKHTLTSMLKKLNHSKNKAQIDGRQDRILVRVIPYLPSLAITLRDPNLSDGAAFVAVRAFRAPSRDGLSIKIRKIESIETFNYIHREFERYWIAADDISKVQF